MILGQRNARMRRARAQLPTLSVMTAPTSQPWAIINSRMLSRCSTMARPSCQLPQVNVQNVTPRPANDIMTPRMCVFTIFSYVSDRKLMRFPEPSGAAAFNVAWSPKSTLSAYLFKIGPPRSWRVGSAFAASALQNLMRRRKFCRLTNDSGRLASAWNSS